MEDTTVSAASYTIAPKDRWVKTNNSNATIILPAATSSLKRDVTIINISDATATVSGLTYGSSSIAGGSSGNFHCDGAVWSRTDGGIPHGRDRDDCGGPVGYSYTQKFTTYSGGTPVVAMGTGMNGSAWTAGGSEMTAKSKWQTASNTLNVSTGSFEFLRLQ